MASNATPYVKDRYIYSEEDNKTIIGVSHYAGSATNGTHESYGYDARNNIETYTDVMGKVHSYSYDAAGRLTREDNQALGFTREYEYDAASGGNITKMTHYAYTPNGTPTNGFEYIQNYISGTDKL